MSLNLMLHCGANAVERNALSGVVLPASTKTFQPLGHDYLADMVQDELEEAGLKVVGEAHGINPSGSKYFGMFEVRGTDAAKDYSTVIGMRNSNSKRFSAAIAVGSGVFVCDNMCFSGDIIIGHKHTVNVQTGLRDRLKEIIEGVLAMEAHQNARFNLYKETQLSDYHAEGLIVDLFREGAITTSQLPKVIEQWDEPDHKEFKHDNVWRLFNAVTESYKENVGVQAIQERGPIVHEVLDFYSEVPELVLPEAA